jgi:soluble lytic murein transglycosylase-like protein
MASPLPKKRRKPLKRKGRPLPRPPARPKRRLNLAQFLRGTWRLVGRGLRAIRPRNRRRLYVLTWAAALTSPVWLLNLAVAFFGHSVVFPLSPFFLREKASALGAYAAHRPLCLFIGHPDMAPLVEHAEVQRHLPRGLLAAIIQVESGGRPHRISAAGAMGPGQLMPGTARLLGVRDPFDSATNVDGAARLIAQHLADFRDTRLAIAAYNAGPAAVRGHVPQNGQTPEYVSRVMKAYAALRPHGPAISARR